MLLYGREEEGQGQTNQVDTEEDLSTLCRYAAFVRQSFLYSVDSNSRCVGMASLDSSMERRTELRLQERWQFRLVILDLVVDIP